MNELLLKLLGYKPASMPLWLFWLLVALAALITSGVVLVGLWVNFTQIDYM